MTKYLNKFEKKLREACNAAIARWAPYTKVEKQIKAIQKTRAKF